MDKLVSLVIVGILCVLKLILTGIFLAIGFRFGARIHEKIEEKYGTPTVATPQSEVANAI